MLELPQRSRNLTVLIVLLASLGMTYYHLRIFLPHALAQRAAKGFGGGYSFGDDFYPIWLTSCEALEHHRNPYSRDVTREIQTGLFGHALDARNPGDPPPNYREFAYPAYVDLLFWPLTLLPFPIVRIVLAVGLAFLTAFSISLWMRAFRIAATPDFFAIALMLTLSSYAVLEGLFAAQPGLIVGFLLAAAFAALVKERLFLAGSLLTFTFIKPQMSIVVVAYLVLWSFSRWRVRRAFLFGLLAWSGLLLITSMIGRPHWIRDWLHVLSGYGSYSPPPLITYSLGPKIGPLLGPPLTVALFAAALLLAWKMRHLEATSALFSPTISLLLALTSITLLPGQAVYDHVILLPGILLIAYTLRRTAIASWTFRAILVVAALVLFWQWIVVIPLLVARPFLSNGRFFGSGLWQLPFHAAASVPLAVCAVLGYFVTGTLRDERLRRRPDLISAARA